MSHLTAENTPLPLDGVSADKKMEALEEQFNDAVIFCDEQGGDPPVFARVVTCAEAINSAQAKPQPV